MPQMNSRLLQIHNKIQPRGSNLNRKLMTEQGGNMNLKRSSRSIGRFGRRNSGLPEGIDDVYDQRYSVLQLQD
jgi:hypothetical protein